MSNNFYLLLQFTFFISMSLSSLSLNCNKWLQNECRWASDKVGFYTWLELMLAIPWEKGVHMLRIGFIYILKRNEKQKNVVWACLYSFSDVWVSWANFKTAQSPFLYLHELCPSGLKNTVISATSHISRWTLSSIKDDEVKWNYERQKT